MKSFHCVFVAVLVAAMPLQARAGVAPSRESVVYKSNDGAVKVPSFGGCPDYGSNHTKEQRDKAYAMGQLAADSYKDGKARPPDGYSTVTSVDDFDHFVGKDSGFAFDPETGTISRPDDPGGFSAVLYRRDPGGELVLAFRGTELNQPADLKADREQISGTIPSQYADAARLLGLVLDRTHDDGTHIDVTGHSLGGGLTQYAMASNDLEGRVDGYTFNSAGLSDETVASLDGGRKHDAGAHLTNIRQAADPLYPGVNTGDAVSFVGWHLGDIYDVPNHDHSVLDHPIGDYKGKDGDGRPRYDGLLGNLARDNDIQDGGGFGSKVGGFFSGAWDYLAWQFSGADEMKGLLGRVGALYSAPLPEESSDGCPCNREAYQRGLDSLGDLWQKWQRAYSAVNGWAAVANASKTFGDAMAAVFSAVEPKQFGGIGSTILGRANDWILKAGETGEWKQSFALSQLGDVKALGEALTELSSLNWSDCETVEQKARYAQLLLDINGELGKLGTDNEILSAMGIGSDALTLLNDLRKKVDGVTSVGQILLDTYNTASEAAKYFDSVSDAMRELERMRSLVPAYEKVMGDLRNASSGCSCGAGCACPHCKQHSGHSGSGGLFDPPEDDDPWTGGGGWGGDPPVKVVVVPGVGGSDGGDDDGLGELVSELDAILDGIGDSSGLVDVTIPDFGLSGSDSPLVPDSIGDPDIAITASGLLNTGAVNGGGSGSSVIVDGNKNGGGSNGKRKPGDIGGRQKEIYSRP